MSRDSVKCQSKQRRKLNFEEQERFSRLAIEFDLLENLKGAFDRVWRVFEIVAVLGNILDTITGRHSLIQWL
jgi:hypothetical protein